MGACTVTSSLKAAACGARHSVLRCALKGGLLPVSLDSVPAHILECQAANRCADGSSWGVLFFSSNGMDVVPTEDRLSWRVIGGVIDLVGCFAGPLSLARPA